jgi:hypothetical protein
LARYPTRSATTLAGTQPQDLRPSDLQEITKNLAGKTAEFQEMSKLLEERIIILAPLGKDRSTAHLERGFILAEMLRLAAKYLQTELQKNECNAGRTYRYSGTVGKREKISSSAELIRLTTKFRLKAQNSIIWKKTSSIQRRLHRRNV